jgi:zinc protease
MGALLAALWAVPLQAQVHQYRLDNGLDIIVKEDHRAPVVVSQIWYKVGSSYEHEGITGLSHMLEHMMFKGTEKHPPGEFSRIIAANGGSENAFTGRDYTAYFQRLERSRLPVAFELEADRMRHLKLLQDEFAKEREVVAEERRLRTEDKPRSLTYERFTATAFLSSGYHWPVVGWMGDIRAYTLDDLQDWYARWYAPNNATLVVVGDVDPDAVHALAQEHFGPLAAMEPPPRTKPRPEAKQRGERRATVKAPARLPYLVMGYKVPVLKTAPQDWEAYALEVAAWVLDGDDASRLSRDLVRGQELAASASAGYSLYARGENLFTLSATPAPGRSVDELEQALRDQVARLREAPVSAEELARVKAQVVADDVYERDSVFYQAMRIGMLQTVGLDWRLADEYVDRIRTVTPEQVQAVARKYLDEDRLTVARLDPLPMETASASPVMPKGGAHVH